MHHSSSLLLRMSTRAITVSRVLNFDETFRMQSRDIVNDTLMIWIKHYLTSSNRVCANEDSTCNRIVIIPSNDSKCSHRDNNGFNYFFLYIKWTLCCNECIRFKTAIQQHSCVCSWIQMFELWYKSKIESEKSTHTTEKKEATEMKIVINVHGSHMNECVRLGILVFRSAIDRMHLMFNMVTIALSSFLLKCTSLNIIERSRAYFSGLKLLLAIKNVFHLSWAPFNLRPSLNLHLCLCRWNDSSALSQHTGVGLIHSNWILYTGCITLIFGSVSLP